MGRAATRPAFRFAAFLGALTFCSALAASGVQSAEPQSDRGKSHQLTEAELAPIRITPVLEDIFKPPPGPLDPPRGLLDPDLGPLHAPRLRLVPTMKPFYPVPGLTIAE